MLLEYGFVHPRPPAMPKYKAGFVIAAYEGLKVDWLSFITEGLKDAIRDLVGGKKPWAGIAKWLTVLVPPVLSIKPKKRVLQETTPKEATKRRQRLEKHTLGWTPEEEAHPEKGQSNRQSEPVGKGKEKLAKKARRTKEPEEEGLMLQKLIKFKVRRPEPEP